MDTQNKTSKPLDLPTHTFWDIAFRPLFLLASIGSIVSILIWVTVLNGVSIPLQLSGLPLNIWHAHEMIFGFAGTVAVGFLLTAAQTWTNSRSTHGQYLIALVAIWFLARLSFLMLTRDALIISIALQIVWWCLSIYALSKVLIYAKNKRNYIFIALIIAIATVNCLVLWYSYQQQIVLATRYTHATVLLFCVAISIISGRTFPFFTERGLKNITLKTTNTLNIVIPSLSLINVIIFITPLSTQFKIIAAIGLISTGVLHLIRLSYWKPQLTFKTPLLWSLHFSYGLLGVGLITLGTSYLTTVIRFNDALHLLTIGTMGAMILSIMSRVSLGHTGRPIKVDRIVAIAFHCLFLSAVIRFLLPMIMKFTLGWNLSAFFWVIAFVIFIVRFTPILTSPKRQP